MNVKKSRSELKQILDRAIKNNKKLLLIGLGNEIMGDDAVGNLIAADLVPENNDFFHSFPAGIAVENTAGIIKKTGADILILIDAVQNKKMKEGSWEFLDPKHLDSSIHSTHTLPLSLIFSLFRTENPLIEIHFIGINIRNTAMFSQISIALEKTRKEIVTAFRWHLHYLVHA
jgi:hydrogenase 3 maturation protease